MRQDELTTRAAAALSAAERLARQASHQAVEVPHVGLALISENDGLVGPLLAKLGVASSAVSAVFEDILKSYPRLKVVKSMLAPDSSDCLSMHGKKLQRCKMSTFLPSTFF